MASWLKKKLDERDKRKLREKLDKELPARVDEEFGPGTYERLAEDKSRRESDP